MAGRQHGRRRVGPHGDRLAQGRLDDPVRPQPDVHPGPRTARRRTGSSSTPRIPWPPIPIRCGSTASPRPRSDRLSQLRAGAFFLDEATSQLHIGSDPTGRTVEASTLSKALSVRASGDRDPWHRDPPLRTVGLDGRRGDARVAVRPAGERRRRRAWRRPASAPRRRTSRWTTSASWTAGCSASTPVSPIACSLTSVLVVGQQRRAVQHRPGGRRDQDRRDPWRDGAQQQLLRQPRPRVLDRHVRLRHDVRQHDVPGQRRDRAVPRRSRAGSTVVDNLLLGQRRVRHQGQQHERREDLEQHVRRQRPTAQPRPGHPSQHESATIRQSTRGFRGRTRPCPGRSVR